MPPSRSCGRLACQVASGSSTPKDHNNALHWLVADLERRLATETRRSAVLAERLSSAKTTVATERSARLSAENEAGVLRQELNVTAASMHAMCCDTASDPAASCPRLNGITLLYVGGRTHHIAQLRAAAERRDARFVHHDGRVEHHLNLLAGLASQADLVVFPVDCISHHAAQMAKQLCRQAGKRFIPFRSASATSLLAALQRPEVTGLADAAD